MSQVKANRKLHSSMVKLPFPPVITAQDILNRRSLERAHAKGPNAFMIYRRAYLEQCHAQQCKFKMTELSPLAGESWKKAPKRVKDAYKNIAREVDRILSDTRKRDSFLSQPSLIFLEEVYGRQPVSISSGTGTKISSTSDGRLPIYSDPSPSTSDHRGQESTTLYHSLSEETSHAGQYREVSDTLSSCVDVLFSSVATIVNIMSQESESITVPFPPSVKPQDFLKGRRNRAINKGPNAFFIYRKAYLDQFRAHGRKAKMTDVSPLISASWRQEPLHVKNAYKDISRQVEGLLAEINQRKASVHMNVEPNLTHHESQETPSLSETASYLEYPCTFDFSAATIHAQSSSHPEPLTEYLGPTNLPFLIQQPQIIPFYYPSDGSYDMFYYFSSA
ncbi:4765_t:CDS:2 [Acaulospora colombiana]|uniref:4765_t:CDS:1 n=1 Tax=Acaulospora colombiana TaxID=27376 RepID=A0ACA9LCP5_9GLOM|nr:4765_t:CDS:2 [Acaulospora colombiana]